mgnify:CR=1 FL=1
MAERTATIMESIAYVNDTMKKSYEEQIAELGVSEEAADKYID